MFISLLDVNCESKSSSFEIWYWKFQTQKSFKFDFNWIQFETKYNILEFVEIVSNEKRGSLQNIMTVAITESQTQIILLFYKPDLCCP